MIQIPQTRLILASGSPRRKALLQMLGLSFDVLVTDADETVSEPVPPESFSKILAQRKAQLAAHKVQNKPCVIIAADTIVSIQGELLGKPQDKQSAYNMLQRLQGAEHDVYTGLCVIDTVLGKQRVECVRTKVFMRPHDDAFLTWYVDTLEPMDKAGAYGIQGKGGLLVERIEGDYYNVVGLPIATLAVMLEALDHQLHNWMK